MQTIRTLVCATDNNNNNKNMRIQRPTAVYSVAPAVLAAVLFVAVIVCSFQSADAATPIYYDTHFYLYAVAADNWVRNDVRYTLNRLRAADGISKSEATQFIAMTASGPPPGTPIKNWSVLSIKALTGSHPWCIPTATNTGLNNGTLICKYDADMGHWAIIYKKGTIDGDEPIYAGDTIRIIGDSPTGGSCAAPPWPTNSASLYCDNSAPDAWQDFHIEV